MEAQQVIMKMMQAMQRMQHGAVLSNIHNEIFTLEIGGMKVILDNHSECVVVACEGDAFTENVREVIELSDLSTDNAPEVLIKEADPELERLLAEEEHIEEHGDMPIHGCEFCFPHEHRCDSGADVTCGTICVHCGHGIRHHESGMNTCSVCVSIAITEGDEFSFICHDFDH